MHIQSFTQAPLCHVSPFVPTHHMHHHQTNTQCRGFPLLPLCNSSFHMCPSCFSIIPPHKCLNKQPYVPSTTPINTLAFIHSLPIQFTLPYTFSVTNTKQQTHSIAVSPTSFSAYFLFTLPSPTTPYSIPHTPKALNISLDLVTQRRGREECLNVHTIQV